MFILHIYYNLLKVDHILVFFNVFFSPIKTKKKTSLLSKTFIKDY